MQRQRQKDKLTKIKINSQNDQGKEKTDSILSQINIEPKIELKPVTNQLDITVAYADEHARSDHNQMLELVWDLTQKYDVTKVLVDASAPSFIRALKLAWGERPDYEKCRERITGLYAC